MKPWRLFIIIFLISSFLISCATIQQDNYKASKINSSKICNINITVIGKGAPPVNANLTEIQKYLFSERAAILDGYRLIAEKLSGLIVKSYSSSKNFIISKDMINTSTSTFLKGVKIVSIKHKDNGVCEATMQMTLTPHQWDTLVKNNVIKKIETCNAK